MKYIREYLDMIKNGPFRMCKEQKQLAKFIEKIFKEEKDNLYVDEIKAEKYLSYEKYFPFNLFPWEKFLIVLMLCVYTIDTHLPRFSTLFCLVGRGAGKNALISYIVFCLSTEANNIQNYNIDIVANSEEQAKISFNDIYNILNNTKYKKKFKKNFYWNKEQITNLKTHSVIKYKTSNAKSADGLRPGAVVFDEIHQYESYKLIDVQRTGLGKVDDPREFYITTDGFVRDAPLDEMKAKSELILKGAMEDNGFLPFICKLDDEKEVHDKENWFKANPSLYYRQGLLKQIEKEYADYKISPYTNLSFMTKRMNIPKTQMDAEVTTWDNILATNQEMEDLTGCDCVVGIDYSKVSDMVGVCLLFRKNHKYYAICHGWFCKHSCDKDRIKAPLEAWEQQGLLTIINDIEINPDDICKWIDEQLNKYYFLKLGLDNFRYALFNNSLKSIDIDGNDKERVKMIRPSDIMKIVPVIDSLFNNHDIIVGDNPLFRWCCNNTKLIDAGKGNFVYDKIEPRSRKTDVFMAFVHAMIASQDVLEDESNEELIFFEPLNF